MNHLYTKKETETGKLMPQSICVSIEIYTAKRALTIVEACNKYSLM